jgi:ubiquinone/menaquinone biosynthesis C-methylase UbiE
MTNASLSQWNTAQTLEQNFWKSYADTYARYPQILLEHLGQLRAAGEFVREEMSAAEIGEALEVGVGPMGIGVLGMQGFRFQITAIDPLPRISLDIPEVALNKYIQTLQERVAYQCSQGETLPFDDESYDFVCCHNVIDHAQNPTAILENMFRVLRKGCCLYLTLHTFSFLGRLKFETLRKFHPEKMIFACHPHSFRHADILEELSNIGYEIIRHEGRGNPIVGRSRLSMFVCRKPV